MTASKATQAASSRAEAWEKLSQEADALHTRLQATEKATRAQTFRVTICNRQIAIARAALGEVALWAQREAAAQASLEDL